MLLIFFKYFNAKPLLIVCDVTKAIILNTQTASFLPCKKMVIVSFFEAFLLAKNVWQRFFREEIETGITVQDFVSDR